MYIYDNTMHISSKIKMFHTKIIERIKKNTLFIFNTFCENFATYEINVGEYGRGLQVTDDNIIQCMHLACRLARARI